MQNLINFGSLALMGVVFIAWAYFMIRMMLTLLPISMARRKTQGAGYFRSIAINLGVYRDFFSTAEHRPARRRVLLTTVLLFVIIIGRIPLINAF